MACKIYQLLQPLLTVLTLYPLNIYLIFFQKSVEKCRAVFKEVTVLGSQEYSDQPLGFHSPADDFSECR